MMQPKHLIIGLCRFKMLKSSINSKRTDHLFDDVSYLEAEAEALKYLIDTIPYDEKPPQGQSIKEMLSLIDYAQHKYYRPVIENILFENRIVKLSDFNHFADSFTEKEYNDLDIHRILNKIIKHRAALLTLMGKMNPIDWEKILKDIQGVEITLYDFIQKMVVDERSLLKSIADLILIYQNEKQHQREINKRLSQRES